MAEEFYQSLKWFALACALALCANCCGSEIPYIFELRTPKAVKNAALDAISARGVPVKAVLGSPRLFVGIGPWAGDNAARVFRFSDGGSAIWLSQSIDWRKRPALLGWVLTEAVAFIFSE